MPVHICAKSTSFLEWAANRNDPSPPTAPLAGFTSMKGNPFLFSVSLSDPIIVGLNLTPSRSGTFLKGTSRKGHMKCSVFKTLDRSAQPQ